MSDKKLDVFIEKIKLNPFASSQNTGSAWTLLKTGDYNVLN